MQRDEAQKRVTLPSVLGKNQRRLPGGGDVCISQHMEESAKGRRYEKNGQSRQDQRNKESP